MTLDAVLDVALGDFHLDVALVAEPGSVLAILGPNGAGKTTILRLLAGSLALDRGHIRLGGRTLDDPATDTFVVPEDRRVGFVHQDLLLFPHLTALDNVAFGPRHHGASRSDARATASAWLERVGLADHAGDRPATLSGGQAQRVAVARALAVQPDLLLLDEPLSALDPTTRGATRRDLRRYLAGHPGPTVLVTHDPLDALSLADHVVVVERGRVTQAGALSEVTARPRTSYVAELLGTNLLEGVAAGHTVRVGAAGVVGGGTVELAEALDGPALLTISPGAITVHTSEPTGSARNRWPARIAAIDLLGERVRLHLDGPVPLVAEITPASMAELQLDVDREVWASVKATEVHAYLR